MGEEVRFEENGITLEVKIKPEKEQAVINEILVGTSTLDSLPAALKQIVEVDLPQRTKELGVVVSKLYVSCPKPSQYGHLFEAAGFKKEVDMPLAFSNDTTGIIVNGADFVYTYQAYRRALMDDLGKYRAMLDEIMKNRQLIDLGFIDDKLRDERYMILKADYRNAEQVLSIGQRVFPVNDDNTFESTGNKKDDINRVKKELDDSDYFVCKKDDKIVGMAGLWLDDMSKDAPTILGYRTRIAEIGDVAVLPEHRGKGIAKILIMAAAEIAIENYQVPHAYTSAHLPAINKVMAILCFKFTGISEKTNHIVIDEPLKEGEEAPFIDNTVWYYVPSSQDSM